MIEIDISLDETEGHDEKLLVDCKKLEIITINLSRTEKIKENKALAL